MIKRVTKRFESGDTIEYEKGKFYEIVVSGWYVFISDNIVNSITFVGEEEPKKPCDFCMIKCGRSWCFNNE